MNFNNDLKHVSPEKAGIPSAAVTKFLDIINDKNVNLHSFMLLRHGNIAAEGYYRPFNDKLLHRIFSVSKSFTSAAIGIAIGEGLLSLEDRIIDFFPEKLEGEVHEFTKMMKVKDLLSMATIHEKSTSTEGEDWVKAFLNTPPTHVPGTIFAYDTTGTHTLCAILQKLTGMTVHEYLKARLFQPIGIGEIEWESCPMGINKGGGGIKCTTEDMARFGQLYLQKGIWKGKRILPEGWVEESTARKIDNSNAKFLLDGLKGYGYQFWRARNNSYCAFGMGGQFILVIPEKDAVFVSTANTQQSKDGHQMILDSFWETIYPFMEDKELRVNEDESESLKKRLENLKISGLVGEKISPLGKKISGKKYEIFHNRFGFEACRFDFKEKTSRLEFYKGEELYSLEFNIEEYVLSKNVFLDEESANTGIWADENTLIINTQLMNWMQVFRLTCRFNGEFITIHILPVGEYKQEDYEGYLNGKKIQKVF